MTTYVIFNSIVSFLTILFCGNMFYRHQKSVLRQEILPIENNEDEIKATRLGDKVYVLLALAFFVIVFAFISPFIFTRPAVNNDFNFSESGQIGDTIGGLMNPFIAIAGVIITGLAFYIQYKANQQQRDLFLKEQAENKKHFQIQLDSQNKQYLLQQFESQFYEMLKLHRENITEMKITGYDFEEEEGKLLREYERTVEGRKIFVTMKTEFECILSLYSKTRTLNKDGFKKCYQIFFFGLDEFAKSNPEEKIFANLLFKVRKQHKEPKEFKIHTNKERKLFDNDVKLNFNYKPFSGHSARLGHYFRHLYLTVKSIVKSQVVTDYNEKMKYLKILRAQLSNHEQMLLFYNWLSDFGHNWENKKHPYFTEYCMIHNLWYQSLFEDPFIENEVDSLRNKAVINRKGNMFEMD